MHYANPVVLNLLWLLIPFAVFLTWGLKRRRQKMSLFIEERLLPEIVEGWDNFRSNKRSNILIILAIAFSILAMARPQWGFEWRKIKRQGLDIFVVVDVSKSMLTADVKPNRLQRTKLAVQDLIKELKGDRIGLIAFAGDAFLVCPLTEDYSGFMLSLDDLGIDTVPRGGTNIGRAIEEAIKGYKDTPAKYKVVIVITDGENLEGDPIAVAKKAKKQGIKVYCIGVGTKEGELVQVPDGRGGMEFLKDNKGNFVKSRLNERLLERIALITGGVYVKSSGANFGLDLIYKKELSKLEKRDIESRLEKRYHERFQIPLAIALVLLVVDTCLRKL